MSGPGAEERQRDVQVLAGNDPPAIGAPTIPELTRLPGSDGIEDVRGEPQGEEETKPFIAPHATGRAHTSLCRFCVKRRRARWSEAITERRRIESRLPGKLKEAPRPPAGVSAW